MLTEALKGDTTLTELNLGGEDNTKRKRKKKEEKDKDKEKKEDRMTGNGIGAEGAKAMS